MQPGTEVPLFQVPLTFCYDFGGLADKHRAAVMHEFAANGAEHFVLTCTLINQILAGAPFAAKLKQEMKSAGLTFVDAHSPFGEYSDLNCPGFSFPPHSRTDGRSDTLPPRRSHDRRTGQRMTI